ncbi:MAG: cytochrome oxidase putative small subunit CydP [Rhodanobacter sp.]
MSSSPVSSASAEAFGGPQRPLRRLGFELFAIVALKIAALLLIWWAVFAPQPKPDTSAEAVAQRLAPSSHAAPEARP